MLNAIETDRLGVVLLGLRTARDLISSHMAVVQSTSDSQEAHRAFVEKRIPVSEGR